MGIYAVYTAVDGETFKQISFLNKEKLPVQIAELEKKDDVPSCDLGKLWDGLHYLLTGIRTQDAAVDEGLHSEVILGIKPLKIGYDFASGIPAADVVPELSQFSDPGFSRLLLWCRGLCGVGR